MWLVFIQDHQGISNAAPADAPLRQLPIPKAASPKLETNDVAEARIRDCISNLQFYISPTAFFQVWISDSCASLSQENIFVSGI